MKETRDGLRLSKNEINWLSLQFDNSTFNGTIFKKSSVGNGKIHLESSLNRFMMTVITLSGKDLGKVIYGDDTPEGKKKIIASIKKLISNQKKYWS